jgi:hypothetical protein
MYVKSLPAAWSKSTKTMATKRLKNLKNNHFLALLAPFGGYNKS